MRGAVGFARRARHRAASFRLGLAVLLAVHRGPFGQTPTQLAAKRKVRLPMATVQIYFYLDVKQTLANNSPGSLDRPTALGHNLIQLQWVDDKGTKSDVVSSDTHVPVPSQGTVE